MSTAVLTTADRRAATRAPLLFAATRDECDLYGDLVRAAADLPPVAVPPLDWTLMDELTTHLPMQRVPAFDEPTRQGAIVRTVNDRKQSRLWVRFGHRWIELANPSNEVVWRAIGHLVVEIVETGDQS